MAIYNYEEAFGAWDITSRQMRQAIGDWFALYYGGTNTVGSDSCQRVAYTVVSKLVRAVFGEYQASSEEPFPQQLLTELKNTARQAMELSLVGGECYLKPCPGTAGFFFTLIPRTNVLIFGRDAAGNITDIGTVERSTVGKYYYTLLERRTVDEKGYLTIHNKLFRSHNNQHLGVRVPLSVSAEYASLPDVYRYEKPLNSVGLVRLKTPMLNCVDGSHDGVSVYAPAVSLIANIDENESQIIGEFRRGQSRIIASRDLLRDDGSGSLDLTDHLFVGLDEDPEQVGITVFSPQLRHASYLERKQEYLRNVESVIGLKRGMLSDANMDDRTATEITSSAGDYNLTIIDFQKMWEKAVQEAMRVCSILGQLYQIPGAQDIPEDAVTINWGNGVLYDEAKVYAEMKEQVSMGLLQPERLMGWYYNMPCDTPIQREKVRKLYMPEIETEEEEDE